MGVEHVHDEDPAHGQHRLVAVDGEGDRYGLLVDQHRAEHRNLGFNILRRNFLSL